ncbi:MAG: NAD(P)(+) transhydrogenase (Re/Si-specific) subunit beta [Chloroflexi bacterium]|nr:MAG: NAD(P)(+) transhydrogenase (Re/Si-specific) subunit beta [Chloroflexota bacterium]
MDFQSLIPIIYLVAAVTFILGLKGLSGPRTAVNGNRIAAAGMLLAVAATFFDQTFRSYGTSGLFLTLAGMAVGGGAGFYGARVVKMTAMPQMVALFNGAGGGAAALVSILEYVHTVGTAGIEPGPAASSMLGLMIGAVSFSGSAIAFGKLQGLVTPRAFKYGGQQIVTSLLFAGMVIAALLIVLASAGGIQVVSPFVLLAIVAILALAFGVALVMPIGGADMPVVISLLNAFTGLAVAAAGFVLSNVLLIVAGTLVGASGTILTRLMSKAMNRSINNVLFGAFGAAPAGSTTEPVAGAAQGTIRSVTAEDAAILLGYARKVVIVPGYGMAVAQAQHNVRELESALEERGVEVNYAIHPVAGRMPGHMNVLLAEANVPYEKLKEMDDINPEFNRTDVAIVIGANDVVNPAAKNNANSPLYGMPILNVDQSQNVIVIKRSMRPGFAGIENELFISPRTSMLFDDAKEGVAKITQELKKAG